MKIIVAYFPGYKIRYRVSLACNQGRKDAFLGGLGRRNEFPDWLIKTPVHEHLNPDLWF
jgi:hypothetical protein